MNTHSNPSTKVRSWAIEDLKAQRVYAKKMVEKGFDFPLVVAEAFVQGIRDLGYKHTGTALDELIDNAVQAGAESIHVALGFEGDSEKKPTAVAVIDDGHGMDPDMIRLATIWGGTHRFGDRKGFGRYGYGLPSASLSQGKRYTVFSVVDGGRMNKVTVDVEDLVRQGIASNGRVNIPEASPARLPDWLEAYVLEHFGPHGLKHGTVVLLENLDKLDWKTARALKGHLLEHFGVVYRNFLRNVRIAVDGTKVEPTDPLFLTPGFRFYDEGPNRSEALPPAGIVVKDDGKPIGEIRVRYAFIPLAFQMTDRLERGTKNPRFAVLKDHNGFVVLRNGRQIDVVTRNPWVTLNNNDRYWKVEIDFDASLDELFSVTTSKQQVVLTERAWEVLREAGVKKAVEDLRVRYRQAKDKLEAALAEEKEGHKRASEQVMEEIEKFKAPVPMGVEIERNKRAAERLQRTIKQRVIDTGLGVAQAEHVVTAEIEGRRYRVLVESHPYAPFYRVEQIGGQSVLYLNTAHPFYTDIYSSAPPRVRVGIELLLWVLGDTELDSDGDKRTFYENEKVFWSQRLATALKELEKYTPADTDTTDSLEVDDTSVTTTAGV